MGSAIPLRRFNDLEVFLTSHRAAQFLTRSSVLKLHRFFRVSSNRIATDRTGGMALLGLFPLQRLWLQEPGCLGFASPDTFRLQGFSPS
jgi:hypothetical protein